MYCKQWYKVPVSFAGRVPSTTTRIALPSSLFQVMHNMFLNMSTNNRHMSTNFRNMSTNSELVDMFRELVDIFRALVDISRLIIASQHTMNAARDVALTLGGCHRSGCPVLARHTAASYADTKSTNRARQDATCRGREGETK